MAPIVFFSEGSDAAISQAVGSGESACRREGNCLETGQWDGAVGWNWGGRDRCDPSDPLCGPDGRLRESVVGKPVPGPPSGRERPVITHVAALEVSVGRDEAGVLKLGLYGRDAPGSVAQLVDFMSPSGISTLRDESADDDRLYGKTVVPVSLTRGGIVDAIVPGATVDFGVPSQAGAYARSRGTSKAGDGFVAQPRPATTDTADDGVVRFHDAAGLVSVPIGGLGYGGTGFESDDEAYGSSFLITADAVPSLDSGGRGRRRVVGQVLDAASMAFLERLSTLPTQRGIKGVIPGQTAGPPLLKVAVRNVALSKVSAPPPSS